MTADKGGEIGLAAMVARSLRLSEIFANMHVSSDVAYKRAPAFHEAS